MKDFIDNLYSKKWFRIIAGILACAILLTAFILVVVKGAHESKIVYVDGRMTNAEARFMLVLSFVCLLVMLFFGFFFESEMYDDGWKALARYAIPAFAAFGLALGASFISELDSTYYLANGMMVGASVLQVYQTLQRNKNEANNNPFIFKLLIPMGILIVSIALFGFVFAGLPVVINASNTTLLENFHTSNLIISSLAAIVAVGFVVHYTFIGFLSWALLFGIIGLIILAIIAGLVSLIAFVPNQIGFIIACILAIVLLCVPKHFYNKKYPLFGFISIMHFIGTIIVLGIGGIAIKYGSSPIVTQFGILTFVFGGVSYFYTKLFLDDFNFCYNMIARDIIPIVLLVGSAVFAFTRMDIEAGATLGFTIGGVGAGLGLGAILIDVMFIHNELIGGGTSNTSGNTGENTKYSERDVYFMICNTSGGYSDYTAHCASIKIEGKNLSDKGYYQRFDIKVKVRAYRYRNRSESSREGDAKEAANQLMRNLWYKLNGKELGSYFVEIDELEIDH